MNLQLIVTLISLFADLLFIATVFYPKIKKRPYARYYYYCARGS